MKKYLLLIPFFITLLESCNNNNAVNYQTNYDELKKYISIPKNYIEDNTLKWAICSIREDDLIPSPEKYLLITFKLPNQGISIVKNINKKTVRTTQFKYLSKEWYDKNIITSLTTEETKDISNIFFDTNKQGFCLITKDGYMFIMVSNYSTNVLSMF